MPVDWYFYYVKDFAGRLQAQLSYGKPMSEQKPVKMIQPKVLAESVVEKLTLDELKALYPPPEKEKTNV